MDLATLKAAPAPKPKGEQHHRHILNAEKVVAIRARKAAGETERALAAAFGVSRGAIKHIVSRRNWRHIP
jgi:hypothetical protein